MWQTGNGEVQLLRSEHIEQWCLLDIRCRWGFIFGNAMYINSNYIQEYCWDGVKATLGMGEAEVRGASFHLNVLFIVDLLKNFQTWARTTGLSRCHNTAVLKMLTAWFTKAELMGLLERSLGTSQHCVEGAGSRLIGGLGGVNYCSW